MSNKIKSGKEILDDFFSTIQQLDKVDKDIAEILIRLYQQGKLTDINLKNELQTLRDADVRAKN
ncbi:MAG TPA: hypothetical protein PKD34_03615 [Candidatus Doudnabacteria bacterium]|nr:hypothetical protein [Candidatus Doudnabacteria bacterium]